MCLASTDRVMLMNLLKFRLRLGLKLGILMLLLVI